MRLTVLAGLGVDEGQSHAEQRRVRTINVVAMVAFALTTTLTFALGMAGAAALGGESGAAYLFAISLVFLAGYASTLVLNRFGRHEAAVVMLISAGIGNLIASTFFVGFSTGPAVFLVMPALAATLLTRREARFLRWGIVGMSILAYSSLLVINPPAAESLAGTPLEAILAIMNYAGMVAFGVAVVWYQRRLADTAEDALAEANRRSESLLLNILPAETAERLKAGESPIADRVSAVTVLFADIVGFTELADRMEAAELVAKLDGLFSAFDEIVYRHGLEKIKTVGDNYFAVAGLTRTDTTHVENASNAALDMRKELSRHSFEPPQPIRMRFGLHTGPVVAGVIGKRKFSYDLWGDTVNTASRMESTSDANKIQISEQVHDQLPDHYQLQLRGQLDIKGKGTLTTYELIGKLNLPG